MDLANRFLGHESYQDKPAEAIFVAGRGAQHRIGYRIPGPGIPPDLYTDSS